MNDLNLTLIVESETWNTVSIGANVTWVLAMVLADKQGLVRGSKPFLARRANIPIEDIDGYLKELDGEVEVMEDGLKCINISKYLWENRNAARQRAYRARIRANQQQNKPKQ